MRPSLRSGAGSIRRALSDDIGATVPVRLDEEREGELPQNLTFAYLPRGALHSGARPLTTVCAILSGTASVGLRTEYVVGDVRKFGFSVCGCMLTSTLQIDIHARVKLVMLPVGTRRKHRQHRLACHQGSLRSPQHAP